MSGPVERVTVRAKRVRGPRLDPRNGGPQVEGGARNGSLEAAFEDAPEAYVITDRAGRVVRANAAAALLLRVPANALEHKPLADFVARSDAELLQRLSREALKGAGVCRARLRLRPGRGAGADAVASVRHCEPDALLWLLLDVGSLAGVRPSRRMASRMRERIAALETRLREKQSALTREHTMNLSKHRILASASAELLAAVGVVLGWTRLLLADLVAPEEQKRVLQTIERSAFAEGEIAGGLLDVARIEAGKLTLDFGPLDLRDLLAEVVRGHAHLGQARGVSVLARLGDDPCRTSGDRKRLERAFGLCIAGAVERTPVGGTVAVSLERGETWALVRIEHTGEPGSLEASLAPPILELHGGAIHCESEGSGEATRLWAVLPLYPMARAVSPSTRAASPAGPLAGKRVLVVGERRNARDGAASALRSAGAEVSVALGPAVAFAMLTQLRPDTLVVDLGADEEAGLALIELIRATLPPEEGGRVPAVAITPASAPADTARRALAAGFQTHARAQAGQARLVALVQAAIRSS